MNEEVVDINETLIDIPESLAPEEEIAIPFFLTKTEETNNVGNTRAAPCEIVAQEWCSSCEDACELACQDTCEKTCQNCEGVACQIRQCAITETDCCEINAQEWCPSCETTCESICQTTCELNCQNCQGIVCQTTQCSIIEEDCCEVNAQTYCPVDCETACQLACQNVCEKACQSCQGVACQTCQNCEGDVCLSGACQEACQLNACQTCQGACQLNTCQTCQTACQLNTCQTCQTACQLGTSCQSACELACQNCQSTCELACQTNCEIGTLIPKFSWDVPKASGGDLVVTASEWNNFLSFVDQVYETSAGNGVSSGQLITASAVNGAARVTGVSTVAKDQQISASFFNSLVYNANVKCEERNNKNVGT